MRLSNLGRFKIPFQFAGTTHVLKITKYTTCDDVIEMILLTRGENTDPKRYVMSEMTSGAQRVLQGRDLVVKVWRSWGCEGRNFSFRIDRKGDAEVALRGGLCLKKFSPEHNIDKLFTTNRRNTDAQTLDKTFVAPYTGHCESIVSESSGKRFVLAKFFKDLKDHGGKRRSLRKSGHGSSNLAAQLDRTRDNVTSSTSFERCQYVWNKYSSSESDSDNESESDFSNSEDERSLDHSSIDGRLADLDNAFVKSSLDDVDEGIDVTSLTSADLNDAFIDNGRCNQYQPEQRESRYDSDVHANTGSEDNYIYVRALFGSGDINRASEDDEMESFMCSRLDSM